MRNLIKSDLYYHIRNKKAYIVAFVSLIALITSYIFDDLDISTSQTVSDIFRVMADKQLPLAAIFLLGVTCYYQGKMFGNRFMIYQVINHGRIRTIVSKYIVQSMCNILFFTGVVFLPLICISVINQVPYTLDTQMFITYILMGILIIRYSVYLVSMVMLFKNGAKGSVVAWMIFVAESLPLLIGLEYEIDRLMEISRIFVPAQMYLLAKTGQTGEMLPIICVTTAVELVLTVSITLHKYKNEDFV